MSDYEWFAPVYDAWAARMVDDVDFYVDLAREAEGPVVELAVGTGRIAIPIVERAGKRVIGIDLSPEMLELARAHADEAGVELELHEGDMRELDFQEATDLVICPYRALLHLPTWTDRRRVFERVSRALRPGGRFAWNAFVFDHRYASEFDGKWQDEPKRHLTEYAPGDNRVDITLEDGPTLSLWWLTRSEWEGLIDVAGFEVEALYGWFDRRPYEGGEDQIWVCRRR
jgi:ubiquinone/menaquinone biosynthesis C-methylase UbiE